MILNRAMPHNPFDRRALPGVAPFDPDAWLYRSDTCAGQLAARDALLTERRAEVTWADPRAMPALQELLECVLGALPPGYRRTGQAVTRPDGVTVPVDADDPLATLTRAVQEDFVVMEKRGAEHVLDAATLCFPSSWTLAEKKGRALVSIHNPVPEYDGNVARRVQRLFDGVQVGRPLTRYNLIWSDVPDLYNPKKEATRHREIDANTAPYLRSERQCILRLPKTRATVFSIHTFMMTRADALALRAQAAGQGAA